MTPTSEFGMRDAESRAEFDVQMFGKLDRPTAEVPSVEVARR